MINEVMSFALATDLPSFVLLVGQLFLVVAAVIFALSSLDDLFIDIYFFMRYLYKKIWITPVHGKFNLKVLSETPEEPLALMLPAWKEAEVLDSAVTNLIATLDYHNYHVFIGTYPNDLETQAVVDGLERKFPNVHKVVTALPGPTCKADCLNAIINEIYLFEEQANLSFAGVIMQDAEDVVHPLSMKLFNYLLPRFDLIQIPVISLERKWWDLTGGHYMDEFAEAHSKEMIVREHFAGVVPGAGVGTAYSRRALDVASGFGEIFSTHSLTEDYEFSFRLRDAGLKQVFARVPVRRTHTGQNGKQKTVTDYIATREFFPNRFWASVRQKTRWVIGITFQGWRSFGWRGDWRTKFLFWRDRKMVFFAHAIMLGYVAIILMASVHLYTYLFLDDYHMAPLLEPENPLWSLLYFNFGVLVYRLIQRHIWCYTYYSWRAIPMVAPRFVWGAVINYLALCRALVIYTKHLITGQTIGWDKTSHDFPTESDLSVFKRRLGDLLMERDLVNGEQLSDALKEQGRTGKKLGETMIGLSMLSEQDLQKALRVQERIQARGGVMEGEAEGRKVA